MVTFAFPDSGRFVSTQCVVENQVMTCHEILTAHKSSQMRELGFTPTHAREIRISFSDEVERDFVVLVLVLYVAVGVHQQLHGVGASSLFGPPSALFVGSVIQTGQRSDWRQFLSWSKPKLLEKRREKIATNVTKVGFLFCECRRRHWAWSSSSSSSSSASCCDGTRMRTICIGGWTRRPCPHPPSRGLAVAPAPAAPTPPTPRPPSDNRRPSRAGPSGRRPTWCDG